MVAEPPLAEAGRVLDENRRRLAQSDISILGRSLPELRHQARLAAVTAARAYLLDAGEPIPSTDGASLIMAGHQPELFHPGVWVKHFALNGLGRRQGVTPISLVVDNDTVKSAALQVPDVIEPPPSLDEFRPRVMSVPFDRWTREIPYEERTVQDEDLFASLAERIPQGWGFVPLLHAFWPEVCRQSRRTNLLGERLVAARRAWERRWGCHNLEVPVSRLSRTEPFAWFACHLLAELPRFHAVYNGSVHDYRRAHGIRDHSHPVPDLATEGDWLETPFWAWRADQPRRGRLFARIGQRSLELRAGNDELPSLLLSTQYSVLSTQHSLPSTECSSLDAEPCVAAWQDLERRGFRVRPRALTNTLYARLFVTDLFMHGIGGGRYDELTDEIIRRFYVIEPPAYLVLSATLLLPFTVYPARAEHCRRLARDARDLHWNPQRHLGTAFTPNAALRKLADQKRDWIERRPTDRQQRRERFRMLRELTEGLRQSAAEPERRLLRKLTLCQEQLQVNAFLQRRDYAFCLYPEALLRPFCTQFL
jgi:hypothetical protein